MATTVRRRARPRSGGRRTASLIGPLLAISLAMVPPAGAVTFAVDSTADEIDALPGNGLCASASGACTLRAAIQEANALPGADEVDVPSGTYVLSIPGVDENACATGDLDVTESITLTGAGAASTVIDAAGIDRILDERGASLMAASGLALSGAAAAGGDTAGAIRIGGQSGLTLADCVVADNGAGAIYADGRSTCRVDRCVMRDNLGSAITMYDDVSVTLENTLFLRNEGDAGGAIFASGVTGALAVTRCVFELNRATRGGGGAIHLDSIGPVLIEDTRFLANSTAGVGGAIVGFKNFDVTLRRVTIEGCTASVDAGAIFLTNFKSAREAFTVIDSTIHGNASPGPVGGIRIDADIVLPDDGKITLVNSTLSGNSGTSIAISSFRCTLLNTTMVPDQVAVAAVGGSVVEFGRSVVAGASASDCESEVVSLGRNLFGSHAFCTITGDTASDLVGADPLLGPLQDNGGATSTHALLIGSPAIDAAADACVDETGAPLLADQRGVPRPLDGEGDGVADCDAGAFEVDCTIDSDGDTLGDECDCDPADPGVLRVPDEAEMRVGRDLATGDALVSWLDLTLDAGSGTLYEVASASIGELWTARIADGPCVATALPSPSWTDARPVTDRGWYYLVRGVNACGPATSQGWGRDSLGVERPACP